VALFFKTHAILKNHACQETHACFDYACSNPHAAKFLHAPFNKKNKGLHVNEVNVAAIHQQNKLSRAHAFHKEKLVGRFFNSASGALALPER
jgi:hypothetical protein